MSVSTRWAGPMLATLTDQRFSDPDWIYERKLDGVRALCMRDGGGDPKLLSRNNNLIVDSYPEIVDALAALGGERFVADGEIVAFDGGRTSFAKLQSRIHLTERARIDETGVRVCYYLFDLLVHGDEDLTGKPLRERKNALRQAFTFTDPLRYSTHRNRDGKEYFEQACARGWEGVIAKRASSPYRSGRTGDWLKFKCARGQEFVVGGFTDPQGTRAGFGALLLGYYQDGRLRYAGKVGTGFDNRLLREYRRKLDARECGESPFSGPVDGDAHWVRPELVAEIGFAEWTRDGRLRHPTFLGFREDKPAADVVREVG